MQARRWFYLVAAGFMGSSLIASCVASEEDMDEAVEEDVAEAYAPLLGTDNPEPIPGQYIVVFKDTATKAQKDTAKGRLSRESRVDVEFGIIPGFSAQLSDDDLDQLRRNPDVAYIEQDQIMHASTIFSSPADGTDRSDQRTGRDGQYNDFNCNGTGVDVYIVDTGIRSTHNEFTGRMGNGFTAINDGRGTEDCNGHGSHVASSAAGTQFGMAKKATLHASRVLNCQGSGTNTGVIQGVDFVRTDCTSKGRRCVANMSLGGGASSALDNAVTNAVNAGITFAVAAGNENQNACNVSPARAAAAVTVGAVADNDSKASFSNFGSCVDIWAPGVSILGANSTSNTATQTISGTSMASPHVAGAAAQFKSCNLSASPAQVLAGLKNNANLKCITGLDANSPNTMLHNNFTAGNFTCGGGGGTPAPDSCVGNNACGGQAPAGCFCDNACVTFGDCCPDGPC